MEDIRWEQRFSNYRKAVAKLGAVVKNKKHDELSELEKDGLIHRFKIAYDISISTIQDILEVKDHRVVKGPKAVLDQAEKSGYITNGSAWKSIQGCCQLIPDGYEQGIANNITKGIYNSYHEFKEVENRLEAILKNR